MTKNAYIAITRTVFGAITLLHLLRLCYRLNVTFGGVPIPFWVSIGIVFLAGILALNGFTLNQK